MDLTWMRSLWLGTEQWDTHTKGLPMLDCFPRHEPELMRPRTGICHNQRHEATQRSKHAPHKLRNACISNQNMQHAYGRLPIHVCHGENMVVIEILSFQILPLLNARPAVCQRLNTRRTHTHLKVADVLREKGMVEIASRVL